MREFVAEQYIPGTDKAAAKRGASLVRIAAEQLASEGTPVEFVGSIFLPEDETCLSFYRADSIEAVREVAARAALSFDRVTAAVSEMGCPTKRGST